MERCLSSLVTLFLLFYTSLEATDFKVASYNLENLFDLTLNGYEYNQYIPNHHNWNRETLHIKLRNLSEVICEIDADVIALQEIENLNALKLLKKSLKYYGCNYKYYAITQKITSSTQVGLLSKFKIDSSRDIKVPKKKFRDILEVKLNIDGNPLYIFVNHWKSKRGGRLSILSSKVLRDRLKNMAGKEYILIGDFNSNYNEKRLTTNLNSSKRLCNIDNNSSHYNLWYELPIYQRWSYNFYGKKEGLDNIIISKTLLDGKRIDYINSSFDRFRANYLFHKKGYILRWQYKNKRHIGVGYSDHLPIFAKFSTKKPFIYPNCLISNGDVKTLKSKDIELPMRLKAKVIEINKNSAYIADSSGEVKIFGLDKKLRVGESYTFIIYKTTIYKGEFEVVDFNIEKG